MFQCRIHKDSPLIPILSGINPAPRIETYVFKIHCDVVLPKGRRSFALLKSSSVMLISRCSLRLKQNISLLALLEVIHESPKSPYSLKAFILLSIFSIERNSCAESDSISFASWMIVYQICRRKASRASTELQQIPALKSQFYFIDEYNNELFI